jgi:hypothetical protein
MATDYKALLEQFGKDYRASRQKELLADIKTLQAGEPRMSFDEAWNRSLPAYPSLSEEEAGTPVLSELETPEPLPALMSLPEPASAILPVSTTGPRAEPLLVHGCDVGLTTPFF